MVRGTWKTKPHLLEGDVGAAAMKALEATIISQAATWSLSGYLVPDQQGLFPIDKLVEDKIFDSSALIFGFSAATMSNQMSTVISVMLRCIILNDFDYATRYLKFSYLCMPVDMFADMLGLFARRLPQN